MPQSIEEMHTRCLSRRRRLSIMRYVDSLWFAAALAYIVWFII